MTGNIAEKYFFLDKQILKEEDIDRKKSKDCLESIIREKGFCKSYSHKGKEYST